MTGRERILRLLDRKKIDRPPVMASFIAAGAYWRHIPQKRIHTDPDFNADTIITLSREFGLDGAYISSDNWIIHHAMGGTVIFPEDDEPWGHPAVLTEWDKLSDLTVPDPEKAERMSFMLKAVRKAVELNNNELFLEANIDSGPFMMAGILRGMERFMYDLSLCPEKVHELLRFCTDVVIEYAKAMARTGADGIQFGDSSATLISTEMYEEFVEPYQKPVIDAIREEGVYPFLHVCGNSNHISGHLGSAGASCVEIDSPADLKKTVEFFKDRSVIRGNVDTILLKDGTAGDVCKSAFSCMEDARNSRFILSPGCGVPRETPKENIRALVETAGEYHMY
jgi:MtaA/CmuA family methyltransferase